MSLSVYAPSPAVFPQLDLILFHVSSLCHRDGSLESHAEEEDYTSVNYLLFSKMQEDCGDTAS